MRNVFLMIAMLAITAACNDVSVEWVSSTYESPWKVMEMAFGTDVGKVIEIDTGKTLHEIEGFGTCFNELGWASLSDLTPEERDGILNELFTPSGANFTFARMPIAANDFSLDYYSYAPVAEDFELKSFSVAHDEDYLIPFIKAAQCFPACTWTPFGLAQFIKHLGPEMDKRDVEVYLGTMERADPELWEYILKDPEASRYIKGMGFQWAGKDALPVLHEWYPDLPCYQTEQECGNGLNDWDGAMHSWDLMLHYLKNGVQGYLYWNTSLHEGGISTWGWRQNSLVVVNKEDKTFRYTPEYYLMKHFSHYVLPGAKVLDLGTEQDVIAFVNPDGSVIVNVVNRGDEQSVAIKVDGRSAEVTLPAGSINTFRFL